MRKSLILIWLLCACNSYAGWFAFAVNDSVQHRSSRGWQAIQKGDPLSATDSIRMGRYASLSVLDDQAKRIYSLQTSRPALLSDLMRSAESTCSSNIARYAKAILRIFRSQEEESLLGSAGVSYRDAAADRAVADLLRQRMSGRAWSVAPVLASDYRMELQAVSLDRSEVCQVVREEERVRLLVSNHSNQALFVAVLDVDAGGVPQLLLPQDMNEMISHMFIPAYSTVMLPDVLSFAPAGIDHLYLIAYEEPFDMQQVLNLLQSNDSPTTPPSSSSSLSSSSSSTPKLGTAHLTLHIR